MNEKRCLGWHCAINKECALYVRDRFPNEQLFQPYPAGDLCDHFRQIEHEWGDGKEVND